MHINPLDMKPEEKVILGAFIKSKPKLLLHDKEYEVELDGKVISFTLATDLIQTPRFSDPSELDYLIPNQKAGDGGFGAVYFIHRYISVQDGIANCYKTTPKVLKYAIHQTEQQVQRAKEEYNLLAKNPLYKARVFITNELEDGFESYIVMDAIEKDTLTQIKHEKYETKAVIELMLATAWSIKRMIHNRDIVHLDLKPANLMVNRQEDKPIYVMPIDLGLATQTGASLERLVGTKNFISPEVTRGEAVNAKADVFALSVIFQYILTHTLSGEMSSELILPEFNLRDDLKKEIATFINAMRVDEADKRTTMSEVMEFLERVFIHYEYQNNTEVNVEQILKQQTLIYEWRDMLLSLENKSLMIVTELDLLDLRNLYKTAFSTLQNVNDTLVKTSLHINAFKDAKSISAILEKVETIIDTYIDLKNNIDAFTKQMKAIMNNRSLFTALSDENQVKLTKIQTRLHKKMQDHDRHMANLDEINHINNKFSIFLQKYPPKVAHILNQNSPRHDQIPDELAITRKQEPASPLKPPTPSRLINRKLATRNTKPKPTSDSSSFMTGFTVSEADNGKEPASNEQPKLNTSKLAQFGLFNDSKNTRKRLFPEQKQQESEKENLPPNDLNSDASPPSPKRSKS